MEARVALHVVASPCLDALQVQVRLVLEPPHFLGRARVDPDARLPRPAHGVEPHHLVLVAQGLQLLPLCMCVVL